MSLRPQPSIPPVPDDTARVAQAAFRHGNPCLLLRDQLGAVFDDAGFADLYPKHGQPAYAPWRLALVTLLQFREGLSDRQAAEAVRARIDWKYLLALDLADPGFDHSLLCELRGYDAGKKIKGRKRHIITDTLGHLVGIDVHPAGMQDRDGAVRVIKEIRSLYPWLRHLFADGGYAGPKLAKKLRKLGKWTLEVVKRSDSAKGFVLLPRRWVVERTFAWLNRCRRLAKDVEATIQSATAWIILAHIRLLTRRIARQW